MVVSEQMTTDATGTTLPYPPRVTPFTERFWQGLRDGVLQTTRCCQCTYMTFPPKPVCPQCWSRAVEWVELSGRGTLYSFTEVSAAPAMFAAEAPYVLCLVDLDEGVRCLSRILARWDELEPDMRVRMVVRETEPVRLFDFVIDDDQEERR
jgi:uncharacterized protein